MAWIVVERLDGKDFKFLAELDAQGLGLGGPLQTKVLERIRTG